MTVNAVMRRSSTPAVRHTRTTLCAVLGGAAACTTQCRFCSKARKREISVAPQPVTGADYGGAPSPSWTVPRIISSVSRTGQHAVHVIESAGRRLLVGTGPSGAPRVLAELGEVELAGAGAGAGAGASAEPAGPWSELIERFAARLGGLGGG